MGLTHGGVIALLLDEVLGMSATRRIWPTFTKTLNVRYLHPVRVGVPLVVTAYIAEERGRWISVRGTLCTQNEPGRVLAEGEAGFIALDGQQRMTLLRSDLQRVGGEAVSRAVEDAI